MSTTYIGFCRFVISDWQNTLRMLLLIAVTLGLVLAVAAVCSTALSVGSAAVFGANVPRWSRWVRKVYGNRRAAGRK